MKQVVFAIALLAMASLTGCLNTDDSSDTTEDNTIEPTGQSGGYSPPVKANITVSTYDQNDLDWVAKDGNRITTSCLEDTSSSYARNLVIYDSDDRIIFLGNDRYDYGGTYCNGGGVEFDITLGPEPVKVGLSSWVTMDVAPPNHFYWLVTF